MVAPIVLTLIKVYLVKKVAIYYAAKEYGFHLIYRRLLEGMKIIKIPKENQKIISKHIKEAFRFPNNAHKLLIENNTAEYLIKYFDNLDIISKNIPKVMYSIKDVLYYKIPYFGRIIDYLKIKK